jgi:hypothetical protein
MPKLNFEHIIITITQVTNDEIHQNTWPPKKILVWAGLDLNDTEIFFLNFPTYSQILKTADPKQFFF